MNFLKNERTRINGQIQKYILFLFFVGLPIILLSQAIESSHHIKIKKNSLLVPDKISEQLILLDFSQDAKWTKVVNHENTLNTGYGKKLGQKGFFLAGPNIPSKAGIKRIDTAWQLWSAEFSVRGMSELIGNIDIYSSRSFKEHFSPFRESYVNAVYWFSADGKSLGRTAFPVAVKKQGYNQVSFRIAVPKQAVAGCLSLGADNPDLKTSDVLLISRVRVGGIPAEGYSFSTDGEVVFPPVRFSPGKTVCTISSDAPKGTSIIAEVAFAADKDGVPAKFSSYGTISRSVPQDTAWVKCRVKFQTDGKACPSLRKVTICGKTIAGWKSLSATNSACIRRESQSPSPDPNQAFVFSVKHDMPVNWRTLRVVLDGNDITTALKRTNTASEPPMLETALFTYAPKKPFTMRTVHKTIVTFSDIYGKTFSKILYFFFDEPLEKGVVTLRDDGLLLVDGKPFFPIGACYVTPLPENGNSLDNAYSWLRKAGFNLICAKPYPREKCREYLDKVASYGIMTYFAPGTGNANCHDIDAIVQTVAEYYRHPSLLSWYIGDDTLNHNTPEQVEMKLEAIRAIDPYHPTCQADTVSFPSFFSPVAQADDLSRYRPVVNFTDIFRAELYPVRNFTEKNAMECVPSIIADMRTIQRDIRDKANSPKNIWGIVQYFEGWNKSEKNATWKRYPTWQELRAMTWGCLIHGAKGLNWYSYQYYPKMFAHGFMYKEETRRNILRMTSEITPLINVLVERANVPAPRVNIISGPLKDALGNDSISVMARKHGDHLYIFALNSAFKPVKAQISAPNASNGIALYENNRMIAVNDGTVVDDFMPYEVHVYRLKYQDK